MMYSSDGGYEDGADARDLCSTLWPGESTDRMWAQGNEENGAETEDQSEQVC